jgi:release factor glutamine methyltransferase
MKTTYKQIVKQLTPLLKNITHIPQKEVEILLLYIIKQNIIWLHINYNKLCDKKDIIELEKLVNKRATSYPLEYITQQTTFYGENFIIKKGVLIPRSETEILVEKAFIILENISNPKVIEVGVGSGIISVMLALLVKDIKIIAVDINDKALDLAKQNANKHGILDKIEFIKSDIFKEINCKDFDMCISNPPYIASNYKLPQNVQFEPSNALFGGEVGNELLKDIITQTTLNTIQYLLCEMGYDQKKSLTKYLTNFKTKNISFYRDLEGFDRGFIVEFIIK